MKPHSLSSSRAKVVLKFRVSKGTESFSLHAVEFTHPQIANTIVSYRGKSAGAFGMGASFQWSPAVRALSTFFLTCVLKGVADLEKEDFTAYPFSGEEGSLAASLDYAISKRPLWLMEMFGSDSKGNSLLRKIVQRSNAERRFGGPVSISLNTVVLSFKDIEIWVNECQIDDSLEISRMLSDIDTNGGKENLKSRVSSVNSLDKIANGFSGDTDMEPLPQMQTCIDYVASQRLLTPLPQIFADPDKLASLTSFFTTEIRSSFSYTNIFSRANYNNLIRDIFEQPASRNLVKDESIFSSAIDRELTGAARLGFSPDKPELHRLIAEHTPIRIAVPFLHAATILLCKGLRYFRGLPIEVDFNYVHTTELSQTLKRNAWSSPPDIVVLNLPATAHLYSSESRMIGDYCPLMLLPGLSHTIVAPDTEENASLTHKNGLAGEYHFMRKEIPTSAACFFDNLRASRLLNMKRSVMVETELCDVFHELATMKADTRVILPAPLFAMLKVYSSCKAIEIPGPDYSICHGVMLIHKNLMKKEAHCRALNILTRDMWMELRDSSVLNSLVSALLLNDTSYLSILARVSGIRGLDL